MRPRRVPLRRSLILRLLVTSILVAVAAIVATAWLAVQTTTRAIQQDQGRSLADDTRVYDKLIEYAATHPNWNGIKTTLDELGELTGRRITLLTENRVLIAESATGPSLATARPSATVDPVDLDPALARGDSTHGIDPRAVGPYKLSDTDRATLRQGADEQLQCLRGRGVEAEIDDRPNGRPAIKIIGADPKNAGPFCTALRIRTLGAERDSLEQLGGLVSGCLGNRLRPSDFEITPEFTILMLAPAPPGVTEDDILACVPEQRRIQLKPYVAPAALLFVTDPDTDSEPQTFALSPENTVRIAGVTGLVLVAAIAVTVLVGMRLVKPLRALTEAARQPVDNQERVAVTSKDEIGYLATALNDLADRRAQLEHGRKAMVNDVAHELRTPLTNIRTWLEAAQDGVTRVDSELLEVLLEEAVLLQHVIDDLRDLAAGDAGQLRIHPEPVYLNDIVAKVIEAHRGAAETAGVRLAVQNVADPEVVVDPARLRQLVGNLVSNAVRHTPRGGSVTLRSRIDSGQLVVDVADTGVGIAPADLPRVFDRFWRADASRSRSTGGSGLGLAIARQLAEAHGGSIGVASRPGIGTVFTVRIPV